MENLPEMDLFKIAMQGVTYTAHHCKDTTLGPDDVIDWHQQLQLPCVCRCGVSVSTLPVPLPL